MASAIIPTVPVGPVGHAPDMRANFAAAKSEIEGLQDSIASLETETDILDTRTITLETDVAVLDARTTALETETAAAGMFSPPDPAGTNSTVYRMMGLGGDVIPLRSGRILVTVDGQIQNSSNGQQTSAVICVGTGPPPANGDPQTGSTIVGQPARFEASSNSAPFVPFSLTALLAGLTAGVDYWIDLAVRVTGGTGSVSDINLTVIEVL